LNELLFIFTFLPQRSCSNYTFVSYRTLECGTCVETDPSAARLGCGEESGPEPGFKIQLSIKLRRLLQDVEVQSKAHMKEKFLADLRKARETWTGQELIRALQGMRRRLDDPNILSGDVILNMLISFRYILIKHNTWLDKSLISLFNHK
jgi:mitogen-activated protein kinase kinase kinase 5